MILSNSIDEIVRKKNIYNWVVPFCIVILIGVVVSIYNFENEVIRTDKSYTTVYKIGKEETGFYKVSAFKKRKLKKKDLLGKLTAGQKIEIINFSDSTWIEITLDGINGLVKRRDVESEQVLVSETNILRHTVSSENYKYPFIFLIGIIISSIILLKAYIDKVRLVKLEYKEDQISSFNENVNDFSKILKDHYLWAIVSEERNYDYKSNAGSTYLLERYNIDYSFSSSPYKNLKCNVNIPSITNNNFGYYFFPDVLLEISSKGYKLISYENVKIKSGHTRFIESEVDASNFEIVDYTYQYVNKDGGPDRRYSDNYEIPICKYTEYEILNEGKTLLRVMCSNSTLIR